MNAITNYIVGLPLGIVLTFVVGMRIMGMCVRKSRERPGWSRDTLPSVTCLLQASGWACWPVSSWQLLLSLSTLPA